MDAKLRVVEGAKEKTIKLKLPMTIGRSGEATLKVPQSQVSRKHCEIYEEDGMLVVDDLGSSNGTFINDERIVEPTFLFPGELLRVGKISFTPEYELPPESEPSEKSQSGFSSAKTKLSSASLTSVGTDDPSEARPEECSESVLNYTESSEGSFLGIDEIETGQAPDPKASSIGEFEVGEEKPKKTVDPGDSALNDFFDNLG
jgi:pSer/pThr/pTyr-binding forkhead associated (FHA) protein